MAIFQRMISSLNKCIETKHFSERGETMNRKKKIIIGIVVVVTGVIWALFGDILLGPAKDWLEEILKPLLFAQLPVWIYVTIFIVIVAITIGINGFIKTNNTDLPSKREIDLKKFIKSFTEYSYKNKFVIATQIYRYKFSKTNYKTKLYYEDGYVIEDEKINAVIQDHFTLDRELYGQLEDAIKEMQDFDDYFLMSQFIEECHTSLNASNLIQDENREVNQFLLSVIGSQYVLNFNNSETEFLGSNRIIRSLSHPEKEKTLYSLSKTGLMRAIINAELNISTLYCFEHTGLGEKVGRVYLSLQVMAVNEPTPYIFLITVSPQILTQTNQTEILSDILTDFVDQLENEIEIEEIQNLRLVV